MSGVTVAEQQRFSESVWSDLAGWLGDTAEAFSQSTQTGAQAWNQLGDAYEHVINTAMQRADQYAVQALNEGRPENAAYWQKFVNQYQQLLAEKQVMQIDKWVQGVHLESLSKIVKPLDIAADLAQGAAALQEAVDTGDGDAFANFLMGFAASTIIATGLSSARGRAGRIDVASVAGDRTGGRHRCDLRR